MRLAEKGRKKFEAPIPFVLDLGKKIPKKIAKKFKKSKKPLSGIIFSENLGREREKKILGPNSAHTGPRQEISEKIAKKLKNHFPALFLTKTG